MSRFGTAIGKIAEQITAWMRGDKTKAEVSVGKGVANASIRFGFPHEGHRFNPIKVWTTGGLEIGFGTMPNSPFRGDDRRRDLLRRINEIHGVNLPEGAIDKYPTISLITFQDAENLTKLFTVLDWFVMELRKVIPENSNGKFTGEL